MHKIAVVLGTRPEAIKLAPVIRSLRKAGNIQVEVCTTGQHREMLDQVLSVFEITPDVDFQLMTEGQGLAEFVSKAIVALDQYNSTSNPSLIVVQGDTSTAFAAALSGFYRSIPTAHVEAGLRTGSLLSPWPEEGNRVLISRLAAIHFAPTEASRANLLREGLDTGAVHVTGNTVVDSLRYAQEKALELDLKGGLPGIPKSLAHSKGRRLVLITGHRRENFGSALESICSAIAELARRYPDTDFVYPVHLNPKVRLPVNRILGRSEGNVYLLDPVPYLTFVALMARSYLILSDSGGVQEEAPYLGKPILITRETTERPEVIACGNGRLVGSDYSKIVSEVSELLSNPKAFQAMSNVTSPFGVGGASTLIADHCVRLLDSK